MADEPASIIRKCWPKGRITFRGDGHYARPEAMAWCEEKSVDYVFGLAGAKPLARKVAEAADMIRTERASSGKLELRAATRAPIEASLLGLDICFVVRNIAPSSAEWIYDSPIARADRWRT